MGAFITSLVLARNDRLRQNDDAIATLRVFALRKKPQETVGEQGKRTKASESEMYHIPEIQQQHEHPD